MENSEPSAASASSNSVPLSDQNSVSDKSESSEQKQNLHAQPTSGSEHQNSDNDVPNATNYELSDELDDVSSPPTPEIQTTRKSRSKQRAGSKLNNEENETNGQHPPSRGRRGRGRGGRGRGRSRSRSALNCINLDAEESLFDAVLNHPSFLSDIVDQWIEKYQSDKDDAMLILLQFFIDSSGAEFRLTPEMQTTMESDAIIHRLTEEDTDRRPEYPLSATRGFKQFPEIFRTFIKTLTLRCQNSIIYDQFLVDKVISLLTGLTDSHVRAYRHTATVALMKMMTAFVVILKTVTGNLENINRQYESERRKSRENRASARLETLIVKRRELDENMQELKEIISYIFTSVFVRRYSDVVAEIRALCIEEIGICIRKLPEFFLDDSYLKYIGWSLYDSAAEVRLKCLEVLQPLFRSASFAPKLDLFARKFKDRIVAMTSDMEVDVAVQAIKIISLMVNSHRDIITDEDCEKIYDLVYSAHRDVAHAAGAFVKARLFTDNKDAEIGVKTKSGKLRMPNTPYIRDLILFFIESESTDRAVFLVDSLIENIEMMKDWECMTDLLLEDAGPEEENLSNEEETRLIEIMVCCIKQAAGEAPIDREPARKIISAKKYKQILDDKRKLTVHFIQKLPLLLDKFQTDSEKTANLLTVPQYFDLELYTKCREEQKLDLLLKTMLRIVDKMHDDEIIETAAKTLECMCNKDLTIFQQCDVERNICLDHIVEKYKEVNKMYTNMIDESLTPERDDTIEFGNSLKKLSMFYSLHDMNSYELWDSLWKTLEDARFPSRILPDETVQYCIRACYFWILWSQNNLIKSDDTSARTVNEAIRTTKRLHAFMDLMIHYVGGDANDSARSSSQEIREEAYNSICDFIIFFNRTMLDYPNPILHQLAYTPDTNMQTTIRRFVAENVFIEEPNDDDRDERSKIVQLYKRRNFLSAYCKVLLHSAFSVISAAYVFKHYLKFNDLYGDIVKTFISKIRDYDRTTCAQTMLRSLIMLYNEIVEAKGEVRRDSDEFAAIKTLAKRFALLFGLYAPKNSEAVLVLHTEGVTFAIELPDGGENDPDILPKNLLFLEILAEFSNKLDGDDKQKLLESVENALRGKSPSEESEEWISLRLYKMSMKHDRVKATSKHNRANRKKNDETAGDEVAEADADSLHESRTKTQEKRVSKKTPLPVSKVRGRPRVRTSVSEESIDTAPIPISPPPAIEDSSQDTDKSNNTIREGVDSLQIHSPASSDYGIFED